jgi:hypothetical protein
MSGTVVGIGGVELVVEANEAYGTVVGAIDIGAGAGATVVGAIDATGTDTAGAGAGAMATGVWVCVFGVVKEVAISRSRVRRFGGLLRRSSSIKTCLRPYL